MRKPCINAIAVALTTSFLLIACNKEDKTAEVVQNYSAIVYQSYQDSLEGAKNLQTSINVFLENPSEETLEMAKKAWIDSRIPYLQTEGYRFYEGPIDSPKLDTNQEGPEGRLNAWPLNEAYIDYVKGNPNSGIINNSEIEISKATLRNKNQSDDEANVSTGYHAIEFLLWGQDLSDNAPGNRAYTDYIKDEPKNERRRKYLKQTTDLMIDDLQFLVDSWMPEKENYAKKFNASPKESLSKILTGIATLSGFELASERLGTALDSGDQEDEHSCFSDTTHNDFIYNAKGIQNIFFGNYKEIQGTSIYSLIKKKDSKLAEQIKTQLNETEKLANSLPHPIDQAVLKTPKESDARKIAEQLVKSLQTQADLFKKAGKVLDIDVKIVTE